MLIYEMVAGYPPFYSENKVEMFKAICDVRYTFPPHFSKVSFNLTAIMLREVPSSKVIFFFFLARTLNLWQHIF